jgi:hypothetical protein
MNMLRLADWGSVKHCFNFDPSSGHFTRQTLPEPRKSLQGFVGFAQELRVGWGQRALFAVYRNGDQIYLSVGKELWPLHSRGVTIEHRSKLFASELIVRAGSKPSYHVHYLHRDTVLKIIDATHNDMDFELAHLPANIPGFSLRNENELTAEWAG